MTTSKEEHLRNWVIISLTFKSVKLFFFDAFLDWIIPNENADPPNNFDIILLLNCFGDLYAVQDEKKSFFFTQ